LGIKELKINALCKVSGALALLFFKHQKVVTMTGRSLQRGALLLQLHGEKIPSPINI
jgi:hypothetical protein